VCSSDLLASHRACYVLAVGQVCGSNQLRSALPVSLPVRLFSASSAGARVAFPVADTDLVSVKQRQDIAKICVAATAQFPSGTSYFTLCNTLSRLPISAAMRRSTAARYPGIAES